MIRFAPANRGPSAAYRIGVVLRLISMAGVFAWTVNVADAAAANAVNPESVRRSEQFVVYDTRRYGRSLASFADGSNSDLVQLEPETLLVSAERIKNALARQLRIPPRGGGQIRCYLYAPLRNNENIVVLSTLHLDGWRYQVQIPDDLERSRLVRGMVQVLLLEFANRGTAQKSAEIPSWLLEGLTRQVLTEVGPELVIDSVPENALRHSNREVRGADPLREAREFLRSHPPLSFAQLSEPFLVSLPVEPMRAYQFSSQILVSELTESNGGHPRLLNMLRDLPNCWNWQTAFLRAFGFERLLDVEKWWSVTVSAFLGRDSLWLASKDVFLVRLDELLNTPVQIRLNTNEVPARAEATLAQVLLEWDYAQQRPVLELKLNQLAMLRPTAPPPVAPLVERYWMCLHDYIQKRDQSGHAPEGRRISNKPGFMLARETLRQLAGLDQERAVLRQQIASNSNSASVARP